MLRLYLDLCCFNRPFDDQSQLRVKLETEAKLAIQERILEGVYEFVWSYIIDFENAQNPFPAKMNSIEDWRAFACTNVSENDSILSFAESLAEKGIKLYDALHISCAVEMQCDYFVTTDRKLLNTSVQGIKIISPIRFIEEQG
ncbi:MAG: PIN domain protein [Proteobacteria bacterium]|nr:PIN domain protein [Pseudomonadota bacterium]